MLSEIVGTCICVSDYAAFLFWRLQVGHLTEMKSWQQTLLLLTFLRVLCFSSGVFLHCRDCFSWMESRNCQHFYWWTWAWSSIPSMSAGDQDLSLPHGKICLLMKRSYRWPSLKLLFYHLWHLSTLNWTQVYLSSFITRASALAFFTFAPICPLGLLWT